MVKAKTHIILVVFCITVLNGYSQTKQDLENRKTTTQQEIEKSNRILQETKKNRRSTLQRVRILNKRIQLRNDLIENINREIQLINMEIEQRGQVIESLEKDLEEVKEQYAELIVKAYLNRSRRDWMVFIMSSENFNQAYRRMKYMQRFTAYRREQAGLIEKMKNDIAEEVEGLEQDKIQKEALILEKENENHSLEREKRDKNRLVSDLVKREKELMAEIEEKRKIAEELEKAIAAIIAEEARKARSRNVYEQLTPEERLISDNFLGNKGKLPWPVERGIITGKYGVHPHPVLKQITIKNDGVDISTIKGAEARALFDGVVTKIVAILGANYTVILRHGNFLTVYQNLVDLKVKQGDNVRVKQALGTVYTDDDSNQTVIHMEIWRESAIQNPEEWISRK